ncbi:PREDICTED: SCO-spondin isoform X3 [Corvus brachyrhynchos]|uniref:SCO-spondin isoform X3 n=1 Tax=Corvus brachyrhynchos TaxID=85066 RepID=UPI0008165C39|nr:PREDICTED: SCO-spondin isoform X3 [Corvus brachyrhynchos]XP_017590478.1 PREDICTED: SCO-spondin isoform X3 [Corvus brachyrhynchos]
MHTRIKPCGSSSQCPCTGRGQGRGAAGVTLALVLPPLSPSPVPHLPCSALSVVHETETLFFPSPPSLAAVGCAVGPWGPWSGCSSPCGVGSRARSRQVTVPPRHGGDPCPDLKQRRGCLGQHPTCGTAKGNVGCLLPSCVVVPMCCRPRCPSWGVFNHPRAPHSCSSARGSQDTAQLLQPGLESCLAKSWAAAAGGALWVGPPCRGQAWSRRLHRDKQVCVECWGNLSQRHPHCTGHGLQGARTFWVAASVVGCQGSWVQEGLQEGCVCSPPALIFV